MIDAGMIEKALCEFFRKDYHIVKDSSKIPEIVRPSMSWCVSGGTFEGDLKTEKLSANCFVVCKNLASEENRRAEAHRTSREVIAKLDGVSLPLPEGLTGAFEPVSWSDATDENYYDKKLMVVHIEFSVSMSAQSDNALIEEGDESLKESIRIAFKRLLESPSFNYHALPTLGAWKFNEKETLAKVFWSNESEVAEERMNSYLRRKDTLNIFVAAPNTPDDWQDKTSLIEEKFNYSKINQAEIRALMPEARAQSLGLVKIAEVSVERPALPGAYAITKISIIVHYALAQRG